LQYIIDTSDMVPEIRQEATEYLATLNEAAQSEDCKHPYGKFTCAECGEPIPWPREMSYEQKG